MSAKIACAVFAFVLLAAAAALLLSGVFKDESGAEKTFSGAHFIQRLPEEPNSFTGSGQEAGHVSDHTLVVSGGDAGRARG